MASGGASPFPWLVLFYLCRRHAGLEAWQSTSWIAPDKSHLSGRSGRRNEVVVGVVLGCNCWLLPWQWQTKDQEVRSHSVQPLIAAWGHTWEIFQRFIITVSQELKWSMHTNVYLRLPMRVYLCVQKCVPIFLGNSSGLSFQILKSYLPAFSWVTIFSYWSLVGSYFLAKE